MNSYLATYWPVLLWLGAGLPGVFFGSRLVGNTLRSAKREHSAMVVQRLVFYCGIAAIVASVLVALKVDLTGVLATAGVLTIAIGFAAQTSLSNYISGLFLMGERTFRVGDLIRVGSSMGLVESIDLLSVKLRTLENTYMRIPNEEMLKSHVVTVTRYPIRRMDIVVRVGFEAPLERVMDLLREVATHNPHCLEEPAPLLLIEELAESGFNLRFGIWFEKSKYIEVRNGIFTGIQRAFLESGIRFQLPRMTVEEYPPTASKSTVEADRA